jgi:hypothetical protein
MMGLIVKERLIALRLLLCARFGQMVLDLGSHVHGLCSSICELEILCIYAFVPLGDGATKTKNIIE